MLATDLFDDDKTPSIKEGVGYMTGLVNPDTNKPWTTDELTARRKKREADAKTRARITRIAHDYAEEPKKMAAAMGLIPSTADTTTTIVPTGQGQAGVPNTVTYGPGVAKPTEPSLGKTWTAPADQGGTYDKKTGAAKLGGKPMIALKDLPASIQARLNPTVKEHIDTMLKNVETKEDVQKIKQYIDRQFTKHGFVSEGDFNIRNSLLEQVTKIAAVRRKAAR